jgi:hypothetical protein
MSRAASATQSGAMAAKSASTNKARINVIYYSMYGHIAKSKYRYIRSKWIALCFF